MLKLILAFPMYLYLYLNSLNTSLRQEIDVKCSRGINLSWSSGAKDPDQCSSREQPKLVKSGAVFCCRGQIEVIPLFSIGSMYGRGEWGKLCHFSEKLVWNLLVCC
jgi:hypothetical protein